MRHEPLPPPVALCAVHRRSQWQEARQLGGVDFVLPSSRPPAADMRPLSTAPGACDDTDEQSEHGDQPCRKTHLSAEKSGKNSTRKNSRNKTGEEDREVVLSQDPLAGPTPGTTAGSYLNIHPVPWGLSGLLSVIQIALEKNVQSIQRLSCLVVRCSNLLGSFIRRLGFDHVGSVCSSADPLVFGHRLVADEIVHIDVLIDMLYVAPFAGPAVLEPETNGTDVTSESLLIEAFDDPFVACVTSSF
jgi:hypothetical protein